MLASNSLALYRLPMGQIDEGIRHDGECPLSDKLVAEHEARPATLFLRRDHPRGPRGRTEAVAERWPDVHQTAPLHLPQLGREVVGQIEPRREVLAKPDHAHGALERSRDERPGLLAQLVVVQGEYNPLRLR
jgi:hypothetical protein